MSGMAYDAPTMPGSVATLATCSSDFSASLSRARDAKTTPGTRIAPRGSMRKRWSASWTSSIAASRAGRPHVRGYPRRHVPIAWVEERADRVPAFVRTRTTSRRRWQTEEPPCRACPRPPLAPRRPRSCLSERAAGHSARIGVPTEDRPVKRYLRVLHHGWDRLGATALVRRGRELELMHRALGFATLALVTLAPLLIVVAAVDPLRRGGFASWLVDGMGLTGQSARAVTDIISPSRRVVDTPSVWGGVALAVFGVSF